jgi:hypothetical protein
VLDDLLYFIFVHSAVDPVLLLLEGLTAATDTLASRVAIDSQPLMSLVSLQSGNLARFFAILIPLGLLGLFSAGDL